MGQMGRVNKITAIARSNGCFSRFPQDYLKKESEKVKINRICYNCSLTSPTANPTRQQSMPCAPYDGRIPYTSPQWCRSNPRCA